MFAGFGWRFDSCRCVDFWLFALFRVCLLYESKVECVSLGMKFYIMNIVEC